MRIYLQQHPLLLCKKTKRALNHHEDHNSCSLNEAELLTHDCITCYGSLRAHVPSRDLFVCVYMAMDAACTLLGL